MHQGQNKLNHDNNNIYMKKFLESNWLREVQFFGNTEQKRRNWMQKQVKQK